MNHEDFIINNRLALAAYGWDVYLREGRCALRIDLKEGFNADSTLSDVTVSYGVLTLKWWQFVLNWLLLTPFWPSRLLRFLNGRGDMNLVAALLRYDPRTEIVLWVFCPNGKWYLAKDKPEPLSPPAAFAAFEDYRRAAISPVTVPSVNSALTVRRPARRSSNTALEVADDVLARLVLQPHDSPDSDICSYFALANLFVLRGIDPPPVRNMVRYMKKMGEHHNFEGLKAGNIIMLLDSMKFPGAASYLNLPVGCDMATWLKSAVDQGWLLLLTYAWVEELSHEAAMLLVDDPEFAGIKILVTHGLIPYSVDAESKEMDCIVGWERQPTARVKITEMPFPDWAEAGFGLQHTGIARGILQIWPFPDAMPRDWSWLEAY